MDDNISTSETTIRSTTTSNSIEASVTSTDTPTSATSSRINVKENFESWKLTKTSRYVLPHLLCRNRVEEKMTIENNASDAVVWNIIYLTSDKSFPTSSPTFQQKIDALGWLQEFKKYLNKVMAKEVRATYCNMANQDKWSILREGGETFSSFDELVKRTKYSVGEEV